MNYEDIIRTMAHLYGKTTDWRCFHSSVTLKWFLGKEIIETLKGTDTFIVVDNNPDLRWFAFGVIVEEDKDDLYAIRLFREVL